MAKLTRAEVEDIRRQWEGANRPSLDELASRYHVSISTISAIVKGKSWEDLRKPSLLIVCSNESTAEALHAYFEAAGFIARTATKADATAMLQREPVDAVLCQQDVHDIHCAELAIEARRHRPELPFFIMSAAPYDNTVNEGVTAATVFVEGTPYSNIRAAILSRLKQSN